MIETIKRVKSVPNRRVSGERAEESTSMDEGVRIKELMPRIVKAYGSFIERLYCRGRFVILRKRFTKELVQYIPDGGRVIEVGCGFGLFTLLFASLRRESTFFAFDHDARRIARAKAAASRINLSNVKFYCEDAASLEIEQGYDCGYVMDLVHHVGKRNAKSLLSKIYSALSEESVFIIKEVDSRPAYKRLFTRILDFAMSPHDDVYYWPEEEMKSMLRGIGWDVVSHAMVDFLPYPHLIYICHKHKALTSDRVSHDQLH